MQHEKPVRKFPPPPTLPPEARMGQDDAYQIRHEIQRVLDTNHRGFPGSQPVSFDRKSMKALTERDFYVCEKSDGVRCLMYLTAEPDANGVPKETAYMWDRRDDFYQVQGLHLPRPDDPSGFWLNTLLDGELVNDIESDGRGGTSVVQRFLAFDCLVLDQKVLIDRTLDKRIAYMKERIYDPYKRLFREHPDELQYQPFRFEMKQMQLGYAMEMLFKDVVPKLKHGNDGLIFTCRTTSYVFGTDQNIIKWKPPHENSIDFKIKFDIPVYYPEDGEEPFLDYEITPTIRLFIRGNGNNDIEKGELYVTDEEWESLKARQEPLDERIVECHQDEDKRWRFMRFRDDKVNANHISVYDSVVDSIRDAIGEQDLINIAGEVKKHWKARNDPAQQRA